MMSGCSPKYIKAGHCYATHASNAAQQVAEEGLWWI